MLIQILGTGCAKCRKLAEVSDAAAKSLGLDYKLEKVTEIEKIVALGVMSTPALLVDGTLRVSGRVPSADEMRRILEK
ncbi:MAG: TM0996/MTH895 family glutaredoxin-like protein [Thermoguttaceae bacterium]|nr:TM0996/MTH895 family glutaredoxin-like protein [Thermoguttaceae bacterium]